MSFLKRPGVYWPAERLLGYSRGTYFPPFFLRISTNLIVSCWIHLLFLLWPEIVLSVLISVSDIQLLCSLLYHILTYPRSVIDCYKLLDLHWNRTNYGPRGDRTIYREF
jgi:hypothetical protein